MPDRQPPTTAPVVGRERELSALRDALTAALAGRGSLVLIGGEAGFGKTALAEALLAEAVGRGALVLVGRCYDLSETPPYGPWAEALDRAPRGDSQLPPPDLAGGGLASQAALFTALRDYLTSLTTTRPVALLLDDLHWADPASLDLLRHLGRGLGELPLLLLVTYRADEMSRHHPLYGLLPALTREARAIRLDLRPLEMEELGLMLRRRYRLALADEARLGTYLAARSEGNPFFAGELLRTLEEERVLRLREGAWALGDLVAGGVPVLLRQVIDRRVERLGEDGRRVLALAAVIGQAVHYDLLAALAGDDDEETLLTVLEQATEAGLVGPTADGAGIAFAHALIREVLYEGILPLRRRARHRQIAEVLLARPHPDPDAVAYHFQRAGDARVAEWLIAAGERAEHAYAYLTASERFEAALALQGEQAADHARRGWLLLRLALLHRFGDQRRSLAYLEAAGPQSDAAGDPALSAYLALVQGMLRCIAGDVRQGIAEMEVGVGAIDALLAEAGPAELPPSLMVAIESCDGQGVLVLWRGFTGRFAQALQLGEAIVARDAERAGGQVPRGDVNLGLGLAYAGLGLHERARQALRRAAEGYAAIGNTSMIALTVVSEIHDVLYPLLTDDVAARRHLAAQAEAAYARAATTVGVVVRDARLLSYPIEGDWTTAREVATAVLAESRNRLELEIARETLLFVAWRQGDTELAWRLIAEALAGGPATAPGNSYHTYVITAPRIAAALALEAGALARAREWIEAYDRWHAWSGAVPGEAESHRLWAEYHRAAGDLARSREHAEQALARAGAPRQPLALLAAHRLLGDLDSAAGHPAAASAHLEAALVLANACAAPFERALTLLALAGLRAGTGHLPEALALLDEARAICTPLGARPTLTLIAALARDLDSTARPATAGNLARLSPREIDVLRLLAAGRSTKEIAAALGMSARTTERHIANLYTRINAAGRAEAIAFAHRHGLASR